MYTATRGGAIAVDGTQAYLLDVTRRTSSGTTRITEALWVARGRAWKMEVVTFSSGVKRDALLPVLTTMLHTFRQRSAQHPRRAGRSPDNVIEED